MSILINLTYFYVKYVFQAYGVTFIIALSTLYILGKNSKKSFLLKITIKTSLLKNCLRNIVSVQ